MRAPLDLETSTVGELDTDGEPVTEVDCVPFAAVVAEGRVDTVMELVGAVEVVGEWAVGKRMEGVGEEQAVKVPP